MPSNWRDRYTRKCSVVERNIIIQKLGNRPSGQTREHTVHLVP